MATIDELEAALAALPQGRFDALHDALHGDVAADGGTWVADFARNAYAASVCALLNAAPEMIAGLRRLAIIEAKLGPLVNEVRELRRRNDRRTARDEWTPSEEKDVDRARDRVADAAMTLFPVKG